jgi:hypothetical protein
VSIENSKPFEKIRLSDLETYPVWEDILDDEADEPSVFPVSVLPVDNLDSRFVGTRVTLANGSLLWAMLFGLYPTNARKTEQFLHLRVERGGQWFWLARYWDPDYHRNGPEALADFLALSVDEVFPIGYDVREYATGDPEVLQGQVPKEPRERLPTNERIKMLVP